MCSLLFLRPKGKRFKERKCQMAIPTCSSSLPALPWRPDNTQQEGDWRRLKASRVRWQLIIPTLIKDSLLPVNVKAEFSSGALACLLRSRTCRRFAFSERADAAEENGHAFGWLGLSIAEAKNGMGRWVPGSTTGQGEGTTLDRGAASYGLAASYWKIESAHVSNSPFLPWKNQAWG